jgi:hypothetical protein
MASKIGESGPGSRLTSGAAHSQKIPIFPPKKAKLKIDESSLEIVEFQNLGPWTRDHNLWMRPRAGASAWESFKATHHSEDKTDLESEKQESKIDGVEGRGSSSFRSMDQVGKDNAMLVSDKAYAFLEHGRWDMDVLMQVCVGYRVQDLTWM